MINNEIKSNTVNVVTETEGKKGLKLMKLSEAIKLAEKTGEDVVCLNDKAEIPVVKIMDYKKFQYEKAKKAKDNKKKAKSKMQDIKDIIISDSIAEHDLEIKAKSVDRILKSGDKVRLTIKYKGRSIRLIGQGPERLGTLVSKVTSDYKIDKAPKIEGNRVTMLISPKK